MGLSIKQLNAYNFGFHTINGIKDEIAKGMDLASAFGKYSGLNDVQIEGMIELGLTHQQVGVANFRWCTILILMMRLYLHKRCTSNVLHLNLFSLTRRHDVSF